jgi:2-dehydropantoate 2-reductase
MSALRIAIVGVGSVGGHMAARLSLAGADPCVIARGAHLDAIRKDGLTLTWGDQTEAVQIRASENPSDFGAQDIVVISVKFPQLADAIDQASPLISEGTRFVLAINGLPWWFLQGTSLAGDRQLAEQLDPGGRIAARIPILRSVACVVTSGGARLAPGHIRNTTPNMNKLVLGLEDGSEDPVVAEFAELANRADYSATLVTDIRRHLWEKLVFNAGLAPVSTIAERTAHQSCNDHETRALAIHVIEEIMAIGRALGIDIAVDAQAITDPERAPHHKPSFLADLLAGRPLEIQNGLLAVRSIARSLAVPVPYLTSVAALMAARSEVEAAKHARS